MLGQLKFTIRRNYSNPPMHGGQVVAKVLGDPALRALWEGEVEEMRERILAMRNALFEVITAKIPGRNFDYFLTQRGMFSYTGLTPEQVDRLREEFGVYILRSGRMCIAGLNTRNVEATANAMAAVLATFYPYLLWISRETIIDYWLCAIVAAAMWALIKTKEFSDPRWSIAFGAFAGIGMLTKWTFPFFLILPAIWCARRNWKNAAAAAAIAAAIASIWYLPSLSQLAEFATLNAAGGEFEGDPKRLSFTAVVFYIRALEGYQLFLPLFLAFLARAGKVFAEV